MSITWAADDMQMVPAAKADVSDATADTGCGPHAQHQYLSALLGRLGRHVGGSVSGFGNRFSHALSDFLGAVRAVLCDLDSVSLMASFAAFSAASMLA